MLPTLEMKTFFKDVSIYVHVYLRYNQFITKHSTNVPWITKSSTKIGLLQSNQQPINRVVKFLPPMFLRDSSQEQ